MTRPDSPVQLGKQPVAPGPSKDVLADSVAAFSQTSEAWCTNDLDESQQELLVSILDQYLIDIEEGRQIDIDELCNQHPQLSDILRHYLDGLQLVREMAHADDGSYHDELLPSTPPLRPGRSHPAAHKFARGRLGNYELGGVIGRGAMGIVYRARELHTNQTVAVKVLAYGTALDRTRIDRFRREAKTAASLDHPNVVTVYSVGCERGTHYYAMQLIEGQSLDKCIAAARTLRQNPSSNETAQQPVNLDRAASPLLGRDRFRRIAQLTAAAANALHSAHMAGVIHRDVKPSNLILGNDGQLWVTDFGLARVQSEEGLTQTGDLVGTFRYMSPEQARGHGELIDARTDVYALGATLYELVCLEAAHTAEDTVTLLQEITSQEPLAPHTHAPDIPRDLQTIILRAMRPRPADRYATAAALAADLQRFVEGAPIQAHAISPSERLLAWARRHRHLAVSLLAIWTALLLVLLGTTLVVSREQSRTAVALQETQEQYRQTRNIIDSLAEVAHQLAMMPGAEGLLQDVLDEIIHHYEQVVASSIHDPNLAHDVASVRLDIARLTRLTGTHQQADQAFELAAENPQLAHDGHQDERLAVLHVQALNEWALLASDRGDQALALARLDKITPMLLQLNTQTPQNAYRVAGITALTHNNRAVVLMRNDASALARGELEQAIQILENVHASSTARAFTDSQDAKLRTGLADAFSNLSVLLSEADLYADAAAAAEQSIILRGEIGEATDADELCKAAITHNNLAALFWRAEKVVEAIKTYRRAIELLERSIRRAPTRTDPRDRLAITLNNLGMALTSVYRHEEAEEVFRRGISLAKPAVDADSSDSAAANRLAGIQNNLAVLLRDNGQPREAQELLQNAAQLLQNATHDSQPTAETQAVSEQIRTNYKGLTNFTR